MKIRAYIRLAKRELRGKESYLISASGQPENAPLTTYNGGVLPTVGFALDFDLEDDLFEQMEQPIAEIQINKNTVKGNVKIPTKGDIAMEKLKKGVKQ